MIFQEKIVLNPIGRVKTDAVDNEVKDKSRISQIIIRDELIEALEGVDGFSHLFVLFWLNQTSSKQRMTLKVHLEADWTCLCLEFSLPELAFAQTPSD